MARCAKIAHREVNRCSNPHIERAWTEACFASEEWPAHRGIVSPLPRQKMHQMNHALGEWITTWKQKQKKD
jgi:hypothetical protein